MVKSSYISKNLTQRQIDLLLIIEANELEIFSLEDLVKITGSNVNEIVENLAQKKLLLRIEKGKYCRSNFNDENVLGCFLVPDGIIAYWTALNKHALTEQFSNTIFIQTLKKKNDKLFRGTHYKFIKVHPRKLIGFDTYGYGNRQYRMSNVEKTIVDCFDLIEYSGGFAELLKAFSLSKLNSNKMIDYCMAINNIAVIKRMGFLAEIIEKPGLSAFVKFARKKINAKYNLFDPMGEEKGEFVNDWRLRLNSSREDILEMCKIH